MDSHLRLQQMQAQVPALDSVDLHATDHPVWCATLERICAAIKDSAADVWHPGNPTSPVSGDQLPFGDLWRPAVDVALACLHLRVDAALDPAPAVRIDEDLADALLVRLCLVGEQAVWELYKADRGVGAVVCAYFGLDENRAGPPSCDAYRRFIQRHRSNGLAVLLQEFPVLGRLLAQTVDFWIDNSAEILLRVHRDRPALLAEFAIPAEAHLVGLRQSLGDRHHEGRSVAMLTFSTGARSWKVVYKPRDMRIDFEFQRLLVDEAVIGSLPALATLKVLKGENYGYMELAIHRPYADRHELARFHTNAGRLSAILYLLGYTDGHHENLVASGPDLFLIDIETLFEPIVQDDLRAASRPDSAVSGSPMQARFETSVARTGLFPSWLWVGAPQQAIDTSAFGATTFPTQRAVPGWVNLNSDAMAPGTLAVPNAPPTSLPVCCGEPNPFILYVEEFRAGFQAQSAVILHRRDAWLKSGGVLDRFAGLVGRSVVRATHIYFAIQQQQLQATALRSTSGQQLKIDQLARLFQTTASPERNWPVFQAERSQMAKLDIPRFTHRLDESDLLTEAGGTAVEGYFKASGLADCRRRLASLTDEALAFQLQVIDGMVAAKPLVAHASPVSDPHSPRMTGVRLTAVERLRMVHTIAADLAVRSVDEFPEWLGFDLAKDGQRFDFRPLGLSPYSGALGIATLLACLASSQAARPSAAGLKLGAMVLRVIEPLEGLATQERSGALQRWWRDQPLGLSGCGGQLLALMAICEAGVTRLDASNGRALAGRLLEGFDDKRLIDFPLDVIGGAAGLVGPLLLLNTEHSIRIAMAIGDQLAQSALAERDRTDVNRRSSLLRAGFAGGTAGVMAALARLHLQTGAARYRDCATALLAHERSVLGIGNAGWHARFTVALSGEHGLGDSWCQGLAGVALGRLSLFGTELWDRTALSELEAIFSVIGMNASPSSHLCCGDFGAVAVLRLAHDLLGNHVWRTRSDQIEVSSMRAGGDGRCLANRSDPGNRHLGLMTGLSGIGLVLLDTELSRSLIKTLIGVGLVNQ